MAEGVGREFRYVYRWSRAHGSCSLRRRAAFSPIFSLTSSGGRSPACLFVGQNQPISVTATGIEPQTTAHGVKIEPMKSAVVASAANRGQMVGDGNSSM